MLNGYFNLPDEWRIISKNQPQYDQIIRLMVIFMTTSIINIDALTKIVKTFLGTINNLSSLIYC